MPFSDTAQWNEMLSTLFIHFENEGHFKDIMTF